MKITVQSEPMDAVKVKEALCFYLEDCIARGLSEETVQSYESHIKALNKREPFMEKSIRTINQRTITHIIVLMQNEGVAKKSIESYVRSFRVFMNYCQEQGWTDAVIQKYHAPEVIKPTLTDEQLLTLLKKPDIRLCTFAEFRTWAIINLLVNNGCRMGTVRCILIKDVNFECGRILTRHNKGGRVQSLPMTADLASVLREYLSHRKGEPDDYLFCTEDGNQLSPDVFANSLKRYCARRGLAKYGAHIFRHTFAKKYIVDGHGDMASLQKLMGHRSITTTKSYFEIYDDEIAKNYEARSPLSNLTRKAGNDGKIRMAR